MTTRRRLAMEGERIPVGIGWWVVVFLLLALVLPASLGAQETRGRITGRVTDSTQATIPGATVTVTDVARGTTVTAVTNEQGLFQVNYLLPGTYKVVVELQGFKKQIQDNVLLQISETRDLPIVLEVGGIEEAVSVTAEAAHGEHLGCEPGAGRRSGAPRVTAADSRRSRTRSWGSPPGWRTRAPAARPALRADAHHRLRLPGHAQQPQRPADRRRAEHRDGERQRGHRDLRPAVRHGAGIQGADRDLRRPVRQHRGRRHQHEHQVRDEQAPRFGVLLRRTVQAGARTTSSAEPRGQAASRARRTGPASPSAARSSFRSSTTDGTRRSSCSASSTSRTSARASTPAPTSGCRPRRCATATSPRTRRSSRSTTR